MKKNLDKASLLTTVVTVILCIFFVGGFIIGLNIVLDMEGTFPPVLNEEGLTPAPETAEEALGFLNKSLEKVKNELPKTDTDAAFSIDGDSIKTDASEQFGQSLAYIKGNVESYLADSVDKPSSDYYEDSSNVVRLPKITDDMITGFTCNYIYYQCPSCSKTIDEPLDHCEDCGGERAYELRYADKYKITLELAVQDDVLNTCFAPRSEAEYMKLANDALEGRAALGKIDIEYTGLSVYFEIERLTDKITYLSYQKNMNASFDAGNAFTGDWSKIKGGNVSFDISERFNTSFTWPALTLSEHYMSVEPKGSENLLATLTCDDPTAYEVRWQSSDESIVTVDNEGYFNAGKNPGKAIITASYEFGGITYSDECEIDVKVSIERLSMNHKKVSLNVGETEQLAVKFKPSNATVQTLTWYSENESIATVDPDGTIHAVAPGKVTVYCLSDDGYYKSTSEVTVE